MTAVSRRQAVTAGAEATGIHGIQSVFGQEDCPRARCDSRASVDIVSSVDMGSSRCSSTAVDNRRIRIICGIRRDRASQQAAEGGD